MSHNTSYILCLLEGECLEKCDGRDNRNPELGEEVVHIDFWISMATVPGQEPLTHMGGPLRIRATDVDPLLEHLAQRGLG